MHDLFKKIVSEPSVSGNEQKVKDVIDEELKSVVDAISTDALGNNIKRIGSGKKKVMLAAHCDEVGFIITYVDEQGYAYFKPLGGIDKDIQIGQNVNIQTTSGIIPGVIGRDTTGEITSSSPTSSLWIDVGVGEKKNNVQVGDRVYFDSGYRDAQNKYAFARGGDNKLGVYVTTEVLKKYAAEKNPALSLYTVLTTQEEIDMRGAQVAVRNIAPDFAFVLDTIDATDTPGANREDIGDIRLGKGPVISLGTNTSDGLFSLCRDVAKAHNIPLQLIAEAGNTSTDVDIIQLGSGGVTSMVIYIPIRYMHTPSILFCWDDVENAITLIEKVLKKL